MTTAYPDANYQWRRNGVDVVGAIEATYTIPSASFADAGDYEVVISNICGTATSEIADVFVVAGGGGAGFTPVDVQAGAAEQDLPPNEPETRHKDPLPFP